jgi:competence protein ComEA
MHPVRRSAIFRSAIFGGAVVLAAAVAATAGQDPQAPPPSGEGMPDGPGKDLTVRSCGVCHEPRRAASVRLTRDGWAAVIEGMIARGAKVSEDEFPVVLDYLATHFLGEAAQPINVNTAPQIDLEAVAGLLRREAAAIVEYREAHGPFKTLEDLKNVPGLDFSKIDSRRDFIVAM